MKQCPACQLTYADDGLKFCRQDGAVLVGEQLTESSDTAILAPEKPPTDFDTGGLNNPPSIAVLPFMNISADPENDFFCDGLAEELLSALARLPGLKVAARTSAFAFRGKNSNVRDICSSLGVTSVMEGSVRKSGARMRISVQLVDVDGFQLWSGRYDRGMEDILDLQDEITLAVVDALKIQLLGDLPEARLRRSTADSDAYELYLRGRYCWNKRTADDIRKAMDFFEQAIAKDPNFALAHLGLADCYANIGVYAGVPASDALPRARTAATRAVQADDSLAEAHASLGQVHYRTLNWEQSAAEYERAISLNQNYPVVHHWYSELFRAQRRFQGAAREIKQAKTLDPLSPVFGSFVGEAHHNLGDDAAAIAEWERVINLEPAFPLPHFFIAHAFADQNRFEEAIASAQKAIDLSGRANLFLGGLGYIYAVSGKIGEATDILEELKQRHEAGQAGGYPLAHTCAGLKQNDQAISWLEADFDAGNTTLLAQAGYTPIYNQLKDDPRYRALLKRMGLSLV